MPSPSRVTKSQPPKATARLPDWPFPVEGGKYVDMLERCLESLRGQPRHGNQELFLDDVFIAYLLAFFNPTIRSLRTIEDFSQTRQAQKHLSTTRICRSTLSDFHKLVDPARLGPILAVLREELAQRSADGRVHATDLNSLTRQVIAVDGTFLRAAADVAWAVGSRNQHPGPQRHRARLDLHVDVRTWIPEVIAVPDPGESEGDSACRHITPGALHLYDRGFLSYNLLAAHYQKTAAGDWTPQADFVLRLKKSGSTNTLTLDEVSVNVLSEAARAAGVLSDRIVHSPELAKRDGLGVQLREVILLGSDGQELRLLTSRLDLGAEIIALLYRYRWQIELFFRWLKSYANFNHLISHSAGGVLLQFHVALIGVMLVYLKTGYRPSKYMLSLLSVVAQGATLEEILPILKERERQSALARASAARRRTKKNF